MNKPPYICPRCKKQTRTTIQRDTNTTPYCPTCYKAIEEADARLGRMVRKALQLAYNLRLTKSDDGLVFGVGLYINGPKIGEGATIEQALEAAGIKDE